MANFIYIFVSITMESLRAVGKTIKDNLRNFVVFLIVVLPYVMYYIGRHSSGSGAELLIPVIVFIAAFYINGFANKIGKGSTVPVPVKRFTQSREDGEATVDTARVHELILYVSNLEDWLERKGLLK